MKRVMALLLAMAVLLAHALAIHVDGFGEIGPAREVAHVAFRLARNWVHFGEVAWNVGEQIGWEAYPSPLWIVLAAVAERLYLPVTLFAQVVGVLCALLTLGATARFSVDRVAGVIPPLLLVANATLAATAISGTEWAAVTLFLSAAWVGFERRRWMAMALCLPVLIALRPEGAPMFGLLLVLSLYERLRPRKDGGEPAPLWSFVPGLIALLLMMRMERFDGTSLYGTWLQQLFTPDASTLADGISSTRDALVAWVTPILIPFPLIACLFGRLSGHGARALLMATGWIALVIMGGGSDPAMHISLAPALPLLCVCLQQGILVALDTESRLMETLAWLALLGVAGAGAMASRFPADVGPLQLKTSMTHWMTPKGPMPLASYFPQDQVARNPSARQQGRLALQAEIDHTITMRALGVFLRDNTPAELTIATAWPGATGYLAGIKPAAEGELLPTRGNPIRDLTGRIPTSTSVPQSPFGAREELHLNHLQNADLVILGEIDPGLNEALAPLPGMEHAWVDFLKGPDAGDPENRGPLAGYELVTVPLSAPGANYRPFHMLRKRTLEAQPRLQLKIVGGKVRVELTAGKNSPEPAMPQILDLEIRLRKRGRNTPFFINPYGQVVTVPPRHVLARTDLYWQGRKDLVIRLIEFDLAEAQAACDFDSLRATLYNTSTRSSSPVARAGPPTDLMMP
jgi:hypothetical protein